MKDKSKELGIIQARLERFNSRVLPRMLALLEQVNRGETLSDLDLQFLQKIADEANRDRSITSHPELTELFARAVDLFAEISEKALANEQASDAQR